MLTETREIFSVSQLNRFAREVIEDSLPLVWVEGEISNLSRPSSGHIYFTLKDELAQVRCAFFRGRPRDTKLSLENGAQVLVRTRVSIYEARGDFQLIVDYLEEAGDGKLRRAFELLKEKLAEEGLFDPNAKKPLPQMPQRIGIITSPTGAAIRDVLSVLHRRFPAIQVIIYPTQVQGENAAKQIVHAIQCANQQAFCDVIILTRGGGSLEDLWPFNEEIVARAIFASVIPIVSAVGHEIDFTIADFVADFRAPTPSAAAELVSPNQIEWQTNLLRLQQRLIALMHRTLTEQKQHVSYLQKRLRHPGDLLREQMQRLDYVEQALRRAILSALQEKLVTLNTVYLTLSHHNPAQTIIINVAKLIELSTRLEQTIKQKISYSRQELQSLMRALDTVSPLATLERGYAIVSEKKSGNVVHAATEVKVDDKIRVRLLEGSLLCNVEQIEE
jgi:exodeoxyribonuclease VII large subunit